MPAARGDRGGPWTDDFYDGFDRDKVAIANRHIAPDETKPAGELLYSSARALTYCVQALRSARIDGSRTGMYADPVNQEKLLLAALNCLREYRHDKRFDVEHVRATFAGTPLGEHPDFVRLLSENP
jgi:hypothetical protein